MEKHKEEIYNPPAFPTKVNEDLGDGFITEFEHPGMRLRDYFAAKAMQGMCTQPAEYKTRYGGLDTDAVVRWAYLIADTMLKERSKQ